MWRESFSRGIAAKDGNPESLDCMCMAHSHLQDACTFDCPTPEEQLSLSLFFFFFFFELGITGKEAVISKNSLAIPYCVCATSLTNNPSWIHKQR